MKYGSSKAVRGGLIAAIMAAMTFASGAALADNADRIQPDSENPYYWQYKDEPVLLLAGSKTERFFFLGDLKDHLNEIHAVGANYVRKFDEPTRGQESQALPNFVRPANMPFLKP